ncbi:V-type ATP synthase subunit K [Candidatus Woesearchaeota archaeon]|nr:V-type ATP synthase subunit K [Candidatus Woesearchaeota archaeon]
MEVENMAADLTIPFVALGASLAIGLSAFAAAWAERDIGTAAIGAMAEKEELFGKGLILTVIPETIVIFGLVVAIMILGLAG